MVNPTEGLTHFQDTRGSQVFGPKGRRTDCTGEGGVVLTVKDKGGRCVGEQVVVCVCSQKVEVAVGKGADRESVDFVSPDNHCSVEEIPLNIAWPKRETPNLYRRLYIGGKPWEATVHVTVEGESLPTGVLLKRS